jgi:ClpX C4-type zinc finger protein
MFGRAKKSTEPAPELRCSFCNKSAQDVRKLIAGPTVHICDECVDVCVRIIADDRVAAASSKRHEAMSGSTPPARWPPSDAWCAFCGEIAQLENALLIEDRTLLCERCVASVAMAASEARKGSEPK